MTPGMSDNAGQGNQTATPTRVRQAEAAGRIPLSRELAGSLLWLGGLLAAGSIGTGLATGLLEMARQAWSTAELQGTANQTTGFWWNRATSLFWENLLPVLGITAVVAGLGLALQTRFALFPQLLRPDLARLNPVSNINRIFSVPQWLMVLTAVGKLVSLTLVAWWILAADPGFLLRLSGLPLEEGIARSRDGLLQILVRLTAGVLVIGLADYAIRWWHHQRSLRMTDQEVRDEQRATEAAPQIEARRRLIRQPGHDPGPDGESG